MLNADKIKRLAVEVGFDLCGIVDIRNFSAEREFFDDWLQRGYNAGLDYLARNVDKRFSPALIMPEVKSIIVCGVVYKNDSSLSPEGFQNELGTPKIASYARSRDYHSSIKEMLFMLAECVKQEYGDIKFRAFTDSAPVLEKRLAYEAGLGFIGRNTLLVSPDVGSFLSLGELFVDEQTDHYDLPSVSIGCAGCRRCLEACPNAALTTQGLDARRCISRITVEEKQEDESPCTMDGWVFGCDICQAVCPYNVTAPIYSNQMFRPLFDPRDVSVTDWQTMSKADFMDRFADTPLIRAGYERIMELALKIKK